MPSGTHRTHPGDNSQVAIRPGSLRAITRFAGHGPYVMLAWALAVFPWLIAPGRIEPDTKIDLVVSPARYLARGLEAWSGHTGFGELQNQAYGYLFPMGAFFETGYVLGLPAWGIQRLWWGLMLVTGGLGAALVARRSLRISSVGACVCGLAYALSPRVLTLLAQLSVEAWPGMLLPWFILLVIRHQQGRTTRLRFGTEIAALTVCLGGVNATASLVPLFGALCFALIARMPIKSAAAFVGGAVCGAAWWLGPLLVLGKYAYPFMDYIETSHITTAVTSAPGVLRGASDWVAYIIDASGHPVWQSGWVVAQDTTSIIGGLLLAGLGVMTLAGRGFTPWRGMLLIGAVTMGSAYIGAVHGPLAGTLRTLLDGPLAALRNVHKFDPLIRLPLALGVGYTVVQMMRALIGAQAQAKRESDMATERLSVPEAEIESSPSLRATVMGSLALLALAATMMPFWQGRIGDPGAPLALSASVQQAAQIIDAGAHQDGGATLILPSTRSAAFTWGTYTDEPLAASATSPIAYRASAPLVAPGAIRLMDLADTDLAAGRDIEPLMRTLQDAGIQRIVIRSGATPADQAMDATRELNSLRAHASLFSSIQHVSGNGAAFDIFTLTGRPTAPSGPTLGVLGAPESAVTLAGVGVSPHTPLVIGAAGWITDDARKHVYNNGLPAALAYGPTLPSSAHDDDRIGAKDLSYPGREGSLATERYLGFDTVSGVSLANPFASAYAGPGAGPASALDSSSSTAWLTTAREPDTLTLGWRSGAPAFAFSMTQVALGGAKLSSPTVTADGHALSAHRGTWTVPAGTHHLALTPHAINAVGDIGVVDIHANVALRAITAMPGTIDPTSTGVVMTQQLAHGPATTLRGEDDGTWSRLLTLRAAGAMHLSLTGKNSCAKATLVLNGSPQPHRGCTAEVQLRRGENTIAISNATRVVMTPISEQARAALGLDGGTPKGPVAHTTFSGFNAGWRGDVAGHAVQPVTIDGWRQGFATARTPHVRFAPSKTNTMALQVGGSLAAIALIAALLPWGRRGTNQEKISAIAAVPTTYSADGATSDHNVTPHAPEPSRGVTALVVAAIIAVLLTGWWSIPLIALTLAVPHHRRALAAGIGLATCGPVLAAFGVVAHGSAGAFWGQLLGAWSLLLMGCARWRGPDARMVSRRRSNSATQSGSSQEA